jgi:uncharacterized protein (TIGR02597 family)
MKFFKLALAVVALCGFAHTSLATIVITDFGATATKFGGWTYTPATSTISGTEGLADSLFGATQTPNLDTPVALRLAATATTAPSGSFVITIEDNVGKIATSQFLWSEFVGGSTQTKSFTTVDAGFNFTNVVGWSLDSGGSVQPINVSFSQLSAVPIPEPASVLLLVGGLLVVWSATRPRVLRPALAAAVFALTASGLHAQVFSIPSGYVTINIKPSPNGSAFAISQFSIPLQPAAAITGQTSGRIASVSANEISIASAGWTAGALSTATAPYFVKVTSGPAIGRIFAITANTATDLTLNTGSTNLTTLSIATGASGDTCELLPAFTIKSLFGTPTEGVVGGTNTQFVANQTDKIYMNDSAGVIRFYYYDTDAAQWRRPGSGSPQDNVVITPFSGVSYYRISTTPLSYVFTGKVPSTPVRVPIPTAGTTLMATYFPFSTTLSALGVQGLATWRKVGDAGVTVDNADRLLAEDGAGVLRTYYIEGGVWKRPGSGSNQGAIAIPVGAAIYATRFGAGAGATDAWIRPLPYNLQQ